MSRIEEVKKILANFIHERTGLYIQYGNYEQDGLRQADEELDEETARQICQLLPQPLDDKELREKIKEVIIQNSGFNSHYIPAINTIGEEDWSNLLDQILALLQPKIEEAKREERDKVMLLADELSACILILQEELDKRQITLPKFWSKPIDISFVKKIVEKAKEWQALNS